MDAEILQKFEEQNKKLEAIYKSVERTRKYFLWTLIISIAVMFLPLIGLLFVLPQFINTFNYGNLGL
jgi:type II secretory pathway component PulF